MFWGDEEGDPQAVSASASSNAMTPVELPSEMDADVDTHTRKPRRKPCPEKRIRILNAAVQLFTTRDYHQVLMEHVAEKAGVGKGTVYCYFKTKEDLFLELVTLAVDRASEVIREGIAYPAPVTKRLRRAVAMTLEYFRKNEAFYSILYHDKVFRFCREREGLDKKRAELRGFFIQLLAEGIAEGSIRSDIEPAFAAVILMTSMRASLRSFGGERTSEQLSEQILKIFLEGTEHRERPRPTRKHKRTDSEESENPASHSPTLDSDTIARLDPLAALSEDSRLTSDQSPERDGTGSVDN